MQQRPTGVATMLVSGMNRPRVCAAVEMGDYAPKIVLAHAYARDTSRGNRETIAIFLCHSCEGRNPILFAGFLDPCLRRGDNRGREAVASCDAHVRTSMFLVARPDMST